MAINGVDNSQREHEQYQRRLRELSDKFSEDTEKMRDRYSDNVSGMAAEQSKTVNKLRQEQAQALEDQKANQQREMRRLEDRFEKQSHNDSKTYYDRYGRAQEDYFREMRHQKEQSREQLEKLVEGNSKAIDNLKRSQDEDMWKLRRQGENNKFRTDNEANDKIEKMARSFQAQTKEGTRDFNDKLRAEREQNFSDMRKQKMLSDLRMEQFKNQHDNEVGNLNKASGMREKQLVAEKELAIKKQQESGADSVANYRERLSDNLSRVQADNNFYNAKKDIQHSNELSQMNHEHKMREMDQRLSLERSLASQRNLAEAERNKMTLDNDMARRRGAHDEHLSREAMKKSYEDSIAELKAENHLRARSKEHESQSQFEDMKNDFQKRLAQADHDRIQADATRTMKDQEHNRNSNASHLAEKHRIVGAYEQKQKDLERKTKQQLASQNEYVTAERILEHRAKERAIANANTENMDKLYRQKVKYEGLNENQARDAKAKITSLEDSSRLKSEAQADTYATNLVDLEDIYKRQMEEMRREQMNTLTKLRTDHDSQINALTYDYEYRIRTMAQGYEQKISEMELKHTRESNAAKIEHDRQMRAMVARHKADLEALQEATKKEMALQEMQNKDRFKMQEENHKNELARMRHSNELLRQKS